jgi:hypothetical protein
MKFELTIPYLESMNSAMPPLDKLWILDPISKIGN